MNFKPRTDLNGYHERLRCYIETHLRDAASIAAYEWDNTKPPEILGSESRKAHIDAAVDERAAQLTQWLANRRANYKQRFALYNTADRRKGSRRVTHCSTYLH